ncbi:MAG: hypothetical protein JJE16_02920 [Nitrospiraceae bacterium]|nr:hypothetical protein [Nitrospiraceae bacterium]
MQKSEKRGMFSATPQPAATESKAWETQETRAAGGNVRGADVIQVPRSSHGKQKGVVPVRDRWTKEGP